MHSSNDMLHNKVDLGLCCKATNSESEGRVSHILRSTFKEKWISGSIRDFLMTERTKGA